MSKTNSEKSFEDSRAKLAEALENLEKITIEKLHETSLHSNMFNIEGNEKSIKSRIVEQTATIQNLNIELNNLQKTISKLSTENETLEEQNQSLLKRINQLRSSSANIIDDIESDLNQISKIITKEE
jgi:cell division protein FtsB